MAFRVINVLLTADASSLRSQMLLASREVGIFEKQVQGAAVSAHNASNLMATALKGGGVAVAAGLAYSVKAAADFDAAMRNVNSISGLSEGAFQSLSKEVVGLSRELPQSAATLAEGLYDIASSGFQGAEGLQVLEESAKAASAGLTTTQNSAKAITAVLNAYGLEADDAADVSDTLFQTVNLGVISFEELTGVIGDTVGAAAAAKVDIAQVGAAIATMTLSGISAAEAGTSLNRVFQSIIDPGEQLQATFRHLGYESGHQALEADGLRGVMEKLRVVTGGNVAAIQALFVEQRAVRGAFGLMSAEGENYARVSAGITDAEVRRGATQRALDEQMKSLNAQFKLFVNGANAAAIEVGSHLLPYLIDLLDGIGKLASSAMPMLGGAMDIARAAAAQLAPFLRNVVEIGGDLASVAGSLVTALGPVVAGFLAVAGTGIIQALNGLSAVLSGITGFLADHEGLVTALAVAYGVKLAAQVAAAAAAFVSLALDRVAFQLMDVAGSVDAAAGRFGSLRSMLLAGLGFGVATAGITAFVASLQNAKQNAEELVASFSQGLDTTTLDGLTQALGRATAEGARLTETFGHPLVDTVTGAVQAVTPLRDTIANTAEATKLAAPEIERLGRLQVILAENIGRVGYQTGLAGPAVEALARKLGVDLAVSGNDAKNAVDRVSQGFHNLAANAYGGGEAVVAAAQRPIEEILAASEAVDKFAAKVSEAFLNSTNIISGAGAAMQAGGVGIEQFFQDTITKANTFASQIQEATARGLNPAIVARLLEAGPEQAAPFLQGILADHSGRLIGMANETEAKIQQVNLSVMTFARLTQQAINSETDTMLRDLGTAMNIARVNLESNFTATPQMIHQKIGVPIEDVTRIAREFGIVLKTEIPPTVNTTATADTADAVGKFNDWQGRLERVPRTWNTEATAETTGATGKFNDWQSRLERVPRSWNTEATADTATATGQIEAWHGRIDAVPDSHHTEATVETSFATSMMNNWHSRIDAVPDTHNTTALTDTAHATWKMSEWHRHIDNTPDSHHTEITANPEPGKAAINDFLGALKTIPGKVTTEIGATVKATFGQGEGAPVGGGKIGSGTAGVKSYLSKTGIPYSVSSSFRPFSKGWHGVPGPGGAMATDLVGPNMMAIAKAFEPVTGNLRELIYTPLGWSIKNGRRVPPYAKADHYDHVHVATYDKGGILPPGWTLALNATGHDEQIVNPRLPRTGGDGGWIQPRVTVTASGPTAREIAQEIVGALARQPIAAVVKGPVHASIDPGALARGQHRYAGSYR